MGGGGRHPRPAAAARGQPVRHEEVTARHGTARHGAAQQGTARHGTARHSTAEGDGRWLGAESRCRDIGRTERKQPARLNVL